MRVILLISVMCSVLVKAQEDIIIVKPDEATEYQWMDNFGASDAWSCQFVGKNWDISKREQIAQLLFSTEVDKNGNPKGIGLSLWRFNIGAGSAEQGDSSEIPQVWRRAECFMTPNGEYDWRKQAGQQWFLQKAKDYGVRQFLAFAISPPVNMTLDGKAHGGGLEIFNLQNDKYDDFADFLTQVILHFHKKGIDFNYLSPTNEPQWDWGERISQEGTACTNEEYAHMARALNKAFKTQNIKTKIQLSEAAQIDYIYSDSTNRPQRDNQLEDFFKPESPHYVGDLEKVTSTFSAHSYFTTWPLPDLIEKRMLLKEKLDALENVRYWQTEYCILENNNEIKGGGRDLGMATALYVARLIHHDLTIAGASAWQWWLAVSPHDYKDGLVYTDNDTLNGEVYDSKTLWALGNFSRFVRPGMKRIALWRSDQLSLIQEAKGLMMSAYKNEKEKIVIVAVNYSKDAQNIKISGQRAFVPYITSAREEDNLRKMKTIKADRLFSLAPRSVVTFVSK